MLLPISRSVGLRLFSRPASLLFALLALLVATFPARAQESTPAKPPESKPPQETPLSRERDRGRDTYKISVDVNLVVLHATVVDTKGRFVNDLKRENFRVFENQVEQQITVFRHEDIPISVGLVIDNSGSMQAKRPRVNTAALTFVKTSNREDEVYVVNFNDDYYLDLPKDFSSDIDELKDALERIDSRGSTALYDAILASLDHLQKGTRDKKVLLVITDGEDNASHNTFDQLLRRVQGSHAAIYAIGLLSQDRRREAKRARRALTALAEATGGLAYFPNSVLEVESICTQIAHDIRNQYTLAYYPSNPKKDGTYRSITIETIPPAGLGKLLVRTRTGYYAGTATATSPGQ